MRICLDTPSLVKMGHALYFDTCVSFLSLEVIYLAQLQRQRNCHASMAALSIFITLLAAHT